MSRVRLDPVQARVLGVLLEKQVTTPDVYPLSLNALTSGCNQKSNREPVMDLGEAVVRDAVEALVAMTLVREQGSAGGRTRRFSHRLDSRLFGEMEFSREERAVLCVLLLRGPQTPGEIRARAERLAGFTDLASLQRVLDVMARRQDGPHVELLEREPGRREARYRQLLCIEDDSLVAAVPERRVDAAAPPGEPTLTATSAISTSAISALEARVAALEGRIAALEVALGHAAPGGGDP